MIRSVPETSRAARVCETSRFNKLFQEELNEMLEKIKSLEDTTIFSGYDFSGLDFRGADLDGVMFSRCLLYESKFDGASLCGASFTNCYAAHASLRGAWMVRTTIEKSLFGYCDFSGCDLTNVSLKGSGFVGSNFDGAYLMPIDVGIVSTYFLKAKINNAAYVARTLSYAKNVPYVPMTCPDNGAFIGWKKCRDGKIVKLLIPEDAKRSSAAGRKCRCNKAVVLEIQDILGEKLSDEIVAYSKHDPNFEYLVGATVTVDDFCEDRWEECAAGIHFFINRQEAVDY